MVLMPMMNPLAATLGPRERHSSGGKRTRTHESGRRVEPSTIDCTVGL